MPSDTGSSRPRILIIDDDEDIRGLATAILEQDGFACRSAEDAEDGLQHALSWQPHLILLDLDMPNGNGVEFLRNRLLNETLLAAPVVMLTHSRRPEEMARLITLKISQYILKPIAPDDLIACVRRHIAKAAETDQLDLDLP